MSFSMLVGLGATICKYRYDDVVVLKTRYNVLLHQLQKKSHGITLKKNNLCFDIILFISVIDPRLMKKQKRKQNDFYKKNGR